MAKAIVNATEVVGSVIVTTMREARAMTMAMTKRTAIIILFGTSDSGQYRWTPAQCSLAVASPADEVTAANLLPSTPCLRHHCSVLSCNFNHEHPPAAQ